MNELTIRIIVALIILPIAIGALMIGGMPLKIFLLLIAILMAFEWRNLTTTARNQFKWQLMGVLYIIAPILGIGMLNKCDNGVYLILFIVLQVVVTDIFAYFGGRLMKGRKLAPKISPGKTWSGLITAIICNIIFVCICYQQNLLFTTQFFANMSLIAVGLLGGINSILAQAGDLLESKIKRIFGVKDSGNLLLAHGGILDRLDGFTFVLPFNALVMWCINLYLV